MTRYGGTVLGWKEFFPLLHLTGSIIANQRLLVSDTSSQNTIARMLYIFYTYTYTL